MSFVISDDERRNLVGFKSSPLKLVSKKAEAVLYFSAGVPVETIASFTDRRPSTINGWLGDWREYRLASIFTGHANNENAAILTREQRAQMKRDMALAPSAHGIPGEFWDVPSVRELCFERFKLLYQSNSSYHYLLRFVGLEFKYPDKFDRRRNEGLITERMAQIHTELEPLLADPDTVVLCADEVRVQQETETRKAWLPVGRKTILKVNRQQQAQSYLGLLDQQTFATHLYRLEWQNSATVIEALTKYLKIVPADKRVAIVWDNARFHTSKEIRIALKEGGPLQRVHLIAMPPYAPDHNPIEHVWNAAKGSIANIAYETFDQTCRAFEEYVNTRTFDYRI